jgi:hypothetical protein
MTEKITLTIVFDQANGQINVNGPIHNRMLAYGMLKLAEKAIDESYAKSQVAPPPDGELLTRLRTP